MVQGSCSYLVRHQLKVLIKIPWSSLGKVSNPPCAVPSRQVQAQVLETPLGGATLPFAGFKRSFAFHKSFHPRSPHCRASFLLLGDAYFICCKDTHEKRAGISHISIKAQQPRVLSLFRRSIALLRFRNIYKNWVLKWSFFPSAMPLQRSAKLLQGKYFWKISGNLLQISPFCAWPQEHVEMFGH